IRDLTVTGVQTCALPIYLIAAGRIGAHVDRIVIGLLGDLAPATVPHEPRREMVVALAGPIANAIVLLIVTPALIVSNADLKDMRSEERRVGKECRCRVET